MPTCSLRFQPGCFLEVLSRAPMPADSTWLSESSSRVASTNVCLLILSFYHSLPCTALLVGTCTWPPPHHFVSTPAQVVLASPPRPARMCECSLPPITSNARTREPSQAATASKNTDTDATSPASLCCHCCQCECMHASVQQPCDNWCLNHTMAATGTSVSMDTGNHNPASASLIPCRWSEHGQEHCTLLLLLSHHSKCACTPLQCHNCWHMKASTDHPASALVKASAGTVHRSVFVSRWEHLRPSNATDS